MGFLAVAVFGLLAVAMWACLRECLRPACGSTAVSVPLASSKPCYIVPGAGFMVLPVLRWHIMKR
jgi:hypothetical protein